MGKVQEIIACTASADADAEAQKSAVLGAGAARMLPPDRIKKASHSRSQALIQKRQRQTWLRANGPCRLCGSWVRLEVDHIDPATKLTHRIWSWAKERRESELAKCQPLCRSCHQEKTSAFNRSRLLGRPGQAIKLTQADVAAIVDLRKAGMPVRRIAAQFGINHSTVVRISKKQIWGRLSPTGGAV